MKNKKGFTVVELVASFALAMVVFVFLFEIIIVLKDLYINSGIKTELLHKQAMISNAINDSLTSKEIKIAMTCGDKCLFFVFNDNTTSRLEFDDTNNIFTWGNYTTKLVENSYFGDIVINSETVSGVAENKNDSIINIKIPIYNTTIEDKDFGVNIAYQYDSRTSSISSINFNEETSSEKSIFLNGSVEDIKRVGQSYVDPGYFVYYSNGNVVFNDPSVTVTSTPVDVSGQTYNITYTIMDGATVVATATRYITVVGTYTYNYTGNYQTFTAPVSGVYNIELWGARGAILGDATSGKGSYVSGYINLSTGNQLYVYIGNAPSTGNETTFNGGTGTDGGYPGGGASDIRLTSGAWNDLTSLKSRIMVAGGGGTGVLGYTGVAGGLIGNNGGIATGATQTAGGTSEYPQYGNGSFGIGGGGCGGGGGYYGGGGGLCSNGAGGGSSFISGFAGVNAITSDTTLTHSNNTKHYSNNYFIKSSMQIGTSNSNGHATITYVSPRIYKSTNQLDAVRYIKDCINGSNVNVGNHWVELQALVKGSNVALNKPVVGTSSHYNIEPYVFPYTRATDGNIDSTIYAESSVYGLQCITVDLGSIYNLDEVAVWHYYADTRTYNENTTSVSNDNINWTTIINTSTPETQLGKRISAYGG